MPTIRQKNSVLTKIAVFFGKNRKIMSKHEYKSCGSVPVRLNIILRTFSTYERMINALLEEHEYLNGMEQADKLEKVAEKPEVKKPEVKKAEAKTPEIKKTEVKKPAAAKPVEEAKDE